MMLMASAALGQITAPPPGGPGVAAPPEGAPAAPPPAAASDEPVLVPGIQEITVSPRAWYLFESFGSSKQNALGSDEFMLGGASVSARFTSLPQTTFVLTGLYGTNSPSPIKTQSSSLSSVPFDGGTAFINTSTNTTIDTSRIDIEFLGVTAIPDSDWAWIVGGRFEHHASTTTGTSVQNVLTPFGASPPLPFSFRTTDSIGVYTAKGGLAVSVPMTADNRVRLFGNAMALLGFASPSGSPDFGVIGPDVSVGVQYFFSPTISFDARYRVMVYFLFSQPRTASTTNYVVYQGPMMGVNFKF